MPSRAYPSSRRPRLCLGCAHADSCININLFRVCLVPTDDGQSACQPVLLAAQYWHNDKVCDIMSTTCTHPCPQPPAHSLPFQPISGGAEAIPCKCVSYYSHAHPPLSPTCLADTPCSRCWSAFLATHYPAPLPLSPPVGAEAQLPADVLPLVDPRYGRSS